MEYNCTLCKKEYSSYKSLWNHTKKYHEKMDGNVSTKNEIIEKPVSIMSPINDNLNIYDNNSSCVYCNKKLCDRKSRWRHEQKCKGKNYILKVKEENEKMKEEITKIKKDFMELSKTTGTKSITVNNIIGNNIIGNHIGNIVNNINSLGYEDIQKKLSEKEKINLVTSMRVKEHPIIELVRKIYTDDKFQGDRNTIISNLRAKDCLIYNSDTNKFDATTKNDHIDNIIENRKNNIVSIYNELSTNNKLRPVEIKAIDTYLEEIEHLGKKNPKVKALYEKHKAEIIYIIYNCKEFMNMLRTNLPDVPETDENSIEV